MSKITRSAVRSVTPAFFVALFLAQHSFCSADIWVVAPQLCRGKAYSVTARSAKWSFDAEERVSVATPESTTLEASRLPRGEGNFVVNVRVRLESDSVCRLTLGKRQLDVSSTGLATRLKTDGLDCTINNTNADLQVWTLLTVRRHDGRLTVLLNNQAVGDFGVSTRSIGQINLRSAKGRIAVSNFVVTGETEKVAITAR